jgi:hypothetical protein
MRETEVGFGPFTLLEAQAALIGGLRVALA